MTPKSYLSFVDGYKTIYAEKRSHIGDLANRMNTGLDKLVEASASVAELAKELVVKEKELAVASVKAGKVCTASFLLQARERFFFQFFPSSIVSREIFTRAILSGTGAFYLCDRCPHVLGKDNLQEYFRQN